LQSLFQNDLQDQFELWSAMTITLIYSRDFSLGMEDAYDILDEEEQSL
jgi:hypothetical protein